MEPLEALALKQRVRVQLVPERVLIPVLVQELVEPALEPELVEPALAQHGRARATSNPP